MFSVVIPFSRLQTFENIRLHEALQHVEKCQHIENDISDAYLCQDLPGHDSNLNRLEGDVPPQPRGRPLPHSDAPPVRDRGSGSDQGHNRQQHGHHCKRNTACAVGAIPADEA